MPATARTRRPAGIPRRKHRLSRDEIIDAAVEMVDARGVEALTTIALARRLGVTQPALYTHVDSLDELRIEVARRGIAQLSRELADAVADRVGDDALTALATAYRDYVRRHPERYLLQLGAGRSRQLARLTDRASEPVRTVLRSYGLDDERVRLAHAALRAAIHGFVHLEARGLLGATTPPDQAYTFFMELFRHGLHHTELPADRAGPGP